MTKDDIVIEVAKRSGLPKTRIAAALDLFLGLISEALENRERVELRRFGRFEVVDRRSRVARDLNTNRQIRIPGRVMPRFVPFDAFKRYVADCYQEPSLEGMQKEPFLEPTLSPLQKPVLPAPDEPVPARTVETDPLEAMRRIVEERPDDPAPRLALASACMERFRYEEAAAHCQAVLKQDPNHLDALNQLGKILERQGDYERALETFQRALQVNREHPETLYNLGIFYTGQDDFVAAEREFRRVLEIDASHADAAYQLGVIHTKRGLYVRAIHEFERVLEIDPQRVEAYFHLGRTYDHQERYDDAIRMFEALLKVQPENSQAYWHLGVLYDKKKMGARALAMYQKANMLSAAKKGSDRR